MVKKKGKKQKTVKLIGNETPGQIVRRLLRTYDRNCTQSSTLLCPSLKKAMRECIENESLLVKFVLDFKPEQKCVEDPVFMLEPLTMAIRQEKYSFIKNLYIWNVPIILQHVTALGSLLEKGLYPIVKLELVDCLIDADAVGILARSFKFCHTLSSVNLDHNEFGNKGCAGLCKEMVGNKTITSLSMNYCGLDTESGKPLGLMLSSTALRDLYLDGNDLQCDGVIDLVAVAADFEEAEFTRMKAEAELRAAQESALESEGNKSGDDTIGAVSAAESAHSDGEKKKKKKKKGKKKAKKPPSPPEVAEWFCKLHVADNGLDTYNAQDRHKLIQCVQLLTTLIRYSKHLEELDIDDNLIGDINGQMLVRALEARAEEKLSSVKLRTTHRMAADTFSSLVKLGGGLKKKKGKKGKKKKK